MTSNETYDQRNGPLPENPKVLPISPAPLRTSNENGAPMISPAAKSELIPTGKLRVGINFSNELLTRPETMNDPEPRGIALDLARELAKRLGVGWEFHRYASAGATAESVRTGAWDVAFLGAEPQRANEMTFTAPYLEIEATYLVPPGSPLKKIEDVDREGIRIAISEKSAYDLYLSRNLKHAQLVR